MKQKDAIRLSTEQRELIRDVMDEFEAHLKQQSINMFGFNPAWIYKQINEFRSKYCPNPPKEKPTLKDRAAMIQLAELFLLWTDVDNPIKLRDVRHRMKQLLDQLNEVSDD